ncbi:DUF1003 domain-containing protein [Levilactobacillus tujiorum]|uniref:DUF1003 domain-containing protein n=1 Tax=Levilactobacillus tujiorum TaxID=2912243 RepID=A0ABX1L4N3_9LACO|nr:DUF1003 domain-containing protein [Levilactobacillus tujiorum]MCH5463758.1 DUF1003 domain-containing protein [Levilactobacillus tujiorum]NLR10965.1 DUF1003 domain-containing protein [Lactobacillus sp. HBUAS51387]NLR28837.1 DUF1003 domain-containing protein [Levilactobacillus tujiorum]NLR31649.1 DUF1003 domain-containing protein [Levilactobacillus tujiorum]
MADEQGLHCLVDGEPVTLEGSLQLSELEVGLRNRIKRDYPQSKADDYICGHHLLKYRLEHVDALINADMKQTKKINQKLTKALQSDDYDIIDVNDTLKESLTFGQKVSDDVARFGGSWGFIFVFLFVLIGWMIVNGLHLFGVDFDNYPFILLNLVLSCVAAIQAPIIMMSQNRSADRDRMMAENDYHVNLKSEHELRLLHAKVDHLAQNQVPHTMEIARFQLEILGEIRQELAELRAHDAATGSAERRESHHENMDHS